MEAADEKAGYLAQACHEAFELFPRDCSHAVWHVIKHFRPDQPYMQANELVSFVSKSSEWKEVQLSDLSRLASSGTLVIGGLQGTPNGHVIVVYPGAEKPKGGYFYIRRSTGERKFMSLSGMYARAMSTSMARTPFPGALSRGEKTVRDPWSGTDFPKVKFWQYVGTATYSSQRQREQGQNAPDKREDLDLTWYRSLPPLPSRLPFLFSAVPWDEVDPLGHQR